MKKISLALFKLMLNKKLIGGAYKPIEKLVRFFPLEYRKDVKKTIKKLVTNSYFLSFKSGKCVSLNPRRIKEILEILERN